MKKILLESGRTIGFKSKRGITYYVRNEYGQYLVWVKKEHYVGGTNRCVLIDEYRKPTKEIIDHIELA